MSKLPWAGGRRAWLREQALRLLDDPSRQERLVRHGVSARGTEKVGARARRASSGGWGWRERRGRGTVRARWGGGRRGDLGRERARHGAREGTSRRRLEWKRRTWPCAGRRCWRWSGRGEAARAEERRLGLGQGRGGQGGWCAERAEAPWLTAFGELLGQGRRSEKRNTARTTAAPSPDTPPPTRLLELLVRALSRCDPADIARVAAVLRLAALSERVRFCFCCSFTPRCAGAHPLVGARARLRAAGAARGRELRRAVAVLRCVAVRVHNK